MLWDSCQVGARGRAAQVCHDGKMEIMEITITDTRVLCADRGTSPGAGLLRLLTRPWEEKGGERFHLEANEAQKGECLPVGRADAWH